MSSNELRGVNETNHRCVAVLKNAAHVEKVINNGLSNQIRSEERGVKQSVGVGLFMFVGFYNSQDFFFSLCFFYAATPLFVFYFPLFIWPQIIPLLMFRQHIRKAPQCYNLQGFSSAFNNISNVARTVLEFVLVHLCTVNIKFKKNRI